MLEEERAPAQHTRLADLLDVDIQVVDAAGVRVSTAVEQQALQSALPGGSDVDILQARALGSVHVSDAPLHTGNRVDVLVDGNATYDAMAEAIDAADVSVHLEIYILANDAVGWRLVERLARCARRGVEVLLVVDGLGSRSAKRSLFAPLSAAGVDVRVFHPLDWRSPLRVWRRDHRKLLVVDGRIAFTGGINFSESYASRRRSRLSPRRAVARGWRDTHVRLQGPGVAGFERAFAVRWRQLGGSAPERLPRLPARDRGSDLVGVLTSSGTDNEPSAIVNAIGRAAGIARRRVWLTQAYFAPGAQFVEALCRRARAGVDVRLLLPYRSDFYPVQVAARGHYLTLLRAGVRIFEFQPAVLHAKCVVVDGLWSSIGSCNLDWRSMHFNDELNAVIVSSAVATEMERVFERDLAQSSEVRLDLWAQRNLPKRAVERVARWLSPLW